MFVGTCDSSTTLSNGPLAAAIANQTIDLAGIDADSVIHSADVEPSGEDGR